MIDQIAFRLRPELGQFAKNDSWETAWSFPRANVPSDSEIRSYLQGATEVAFEAFFGDAFFGIRFSSLEKRNEELATLCVRSFRDAENGEEFFSLLSVSEECQNLGHLFSFAEVGAVNAWRSVGTVKIENPYEALKSFEAFWESLSSSPVGHNVTHRKALEFAYEEPVKHWFAFPVSSSVIPFSLDRDLLYGSLRRAITENESNKRSTEKS